MDTIQEFDTLKISEEIEIPSLAELLSFPLLSGASLEDAYEHASSSLRKLLTLIPFNNSKLYQSINLHMQFIKPGFHTKPIDHEHLNRPNDIIHILINSTGNIIPEYTNRFITMTANHIHHVGFSDVPEFRFCLEAIESDNQRPKPWKEAHLKTQWVYRNEEKIVCLEHTDQWGIIIRDRY
jgi:hypothetical protein